MSNASVFAALEEQVAGINDCAQLQAAVNQAASMFQAQYAGIQSQLAALAPIAALITAPTNPTEVITWIGNFIDGFLTPYYQPYVTYTAQLTTLISDYAALGTAIANAATRIGHCTITVPPLT